MNQEYGIDFFKLRRTVSKPCKMPRGSRHKTFLFVARRN